MAYDLKAQEFAYSYYARGYSRERAVREIRKVYPGFAGSTWDEWVAKLDWKQRRALADAKMREFEDLAANTAKVLLLELNDIRERLVKDLKEKGADTQAVYAYTSVAKQIADLSRYHLEHRDGDRVALEVLHRAVEMLLNELRMDAEVAVVLERKAALVGKAVERAAEQFGQDTP